MGYLHYRNQQMLHMVNIYQQTSDSVSSALCMSCLVPCISLNLTSRYIHLNPGPWENSFPGQGLFKKPLFIVQTLKHQANFSLCSVLNFVT